MPAVTASPRFALHLSILLTACLSLACLLPTGQPAHAADAPTDGVPAFGHVFVVVLENKELDRVHREMLADAPQALLSYEFQGRNRLETGAVSVMRAEATARSLIVHAFHTFPECRAILRTQSMFNY